MIIFIDVLQILAVCGLLYMMITQIIIPIWRGQRIFPLRDIRRRRLEEALKTVQEEQDLDEFKRMVQKLEARQKETKHESTEHPQDSHTWS